MNKFTVGKQSVEGIFLALLENLTIVPSCFSFWAWVEWFRSTFPLCRYANTLDTDSVPREPLFAVPKDTCLHVEVKLKSRCNPVARRYQLDDDEKKQGSVKIGRERSNRMIII